MEGKGNPGALPHVTFTKAVSNTKNLSPEKVRNLPRNAQPVSGTVSDSRTGPLSSRHFSRYRKEAQPSFI